MPAVIPEFTVPTIAVNGKDASEVLNTLGNVMERFNGLDGFNASELLAISAVFVAAQALVHDKHNVAQESEASKTMTLDAVKGTMDNFYGAVENGAGHIDHVVMDSKGNITPPEGPPRRDRVH